MGDGNEGVVCLSQSVTLSSTGSCRNIHIYAGYIPTQWQQTQWQRRRKNSLQIYLPLTLLQGFEKVYSGFACERELETEHNWNILTPKLCPSALCLSRSPWLLNRNPGVHSAECWLSLLHLVPLPPQLYSLVLNCPPSVQFVGLILPSNSHAVIWTRLHASAISSHIWRSRCVTSAIFGMACVIVIEQK